MAPSISQNSSTRWVLRKITDLSRATVPFFSVLPNQTKCNKLNVQMESVVKSGPFGGSVIILLQNTTGEVVILLILFERSKSCGGDVTPNMFSLLHPLVQRRI